jgi:hypothetical protein
MQVDERERERLRREPVQPDQRATHRQRPHPAAAARTHLPAHGDEPHDPDDRRAVPQPGRRIPALCPPHARDGHERERHGSTGQTDDADGRQREVAARAAEAHGQTRDEETQLGPVVRPREDEDRRDRKPQRRKARQRPRRNEHAHARDGERRGRGGRHARPAPHVRRAPTRAERADVDGALHLILPPRPDPSAPARGQAT